MSDTAVTQGWDDQQLKAQYGDAGWIHLDPDTPARFSIGSVQSYAQMQRAGRSYRLNHVWVDGHVMSAASAIDIGYMDQAAADYLLSIPHTLDRDPSSIQVQSFAAPTLEQVQAEQAATAVAAKQQARKNFTAAITAHIKKPTETTADNLDAAITALDI